MNAVSYSVTSTVTFTDCVVGADTVMLSHTALFSSALRVSCAVAISAGEGIPVPVLDVITTDMSFLYAHTPFISTFAFATHGTDRAVCLYQSTVTLPVLLVRVSLILVL